MVLWLSISFCTNIFPLQDNPKLLNNESFKDNVALMNTTDLNPVIESAELLTVKEVVKPTTTKESVEVAVTVAQLPTTAPIEVSIRC